MPGINETQLEKVFSDLAYNHLRDKAEALIDYLVGFQMMKQEDDGKRAVGLFGFQIDEDIYLSPVFFLNGEIKGLDSVYSEKSDLFMPLDDDWINSLINRRVTRLGTPDNRSKYERGTGVPNYARLKIIPGGGGSANLKLAMSCMRDDIPTMSAIDGLRMAGCIGQFKEAMDKNPLLREAVEKYYSYLDFTEAPETQTKVAAEEAKPVIIVTSVTDEGVSELTDEQRKEIMAGGVAVVDKRPEGIKSTVYTTESRKRLENPTGGGLYDVLWADGSVKPALIAPNSDPLGGVTVIRLDDKAHCAISPQRVSVVRKYSDQEYVAELDKIGTAPSDVRPNETVLFLSKGGAGTGAFCVDTKYTGINGSTVLAVRDTYYMSHPHLPVTSSGYNPITPYQMLPAEHFFGSGMQDRPNAVAPGHRTSASRGSAGRTDPNRRVAQVIVSVAGGNDPKYAADKLVINDDKFVAIKLNSFTEDKSDKNMIVPNETYSTAKSDIILAARDFGDYSTVLQQLNKVASDLKVWRDGSTINLSSNGAVTSLSKVGAFKHLVVKHAMAADDAQLIVDNASYTPVVYKVKYAAQLLDLPEYQDESSGGEMNSNFPQEVHTRQVVKAVPEDNRELYRYHSPFAGGEDESSDAAGVIQDAARTGNKDVFDATVLGSLVKSHSPTEMADRFLPTITSGMDRLGRMMFLIYWHYDEFEERYGDRDLVEFLDTVKNTFNQLGEVVMFTKKRTMSGDPEHYGLGLKAMGDNNNE